MLIEIQNDLSHSISVDITIPSLQDAGVPYNQTLIAGANSSAQDLLSFSSTLIGTDYSLDFTQGNVGYNEFLVLFDVTITGSGAAIDATDKVNFSATYTLRDIVLSYNINYISALEYDDLLYYGSTPIDENDPSKGNHMYDVDSVLYHDISASYSFDTGTTVSAGITNLTDEEPPYIEPAANGNTDESNYRLFGRSWFVRFSQQF